MYNQIYNCCQRLHYKDVESVNNSVKQLSFDRAKIDFKNIRDLGNRIIVPGTMAIANQWMHYLNDDGSDRYEFLPADTLFSLDSLSTLQGAPLAIQHPGEVRCDNYREMVSQGKVVGSVSTQINIDRDRNQLDIVAVVYDKPTIDQILAKGILEISPSYWKECDRHPDYEANCLIQKSRDYTGCEVSLVKRARGGKNARLHLGADSVIEPPKKYFLSNNLNNIDNAMGTFNLDGISLEVPDQSKQYLEKFIKDKDAAESKLTKERDEAISAKDAAEGKLAKLEAEKATLEAKNAQLEKDNAETKAQMAKDAEERDRSDVIKVALPIFQKANPSFDASALKESSNRRIKEEAIALALDSLEAVKEKRLDKCSDSQIDAYWEVVSVGAVREPPLHRESPVQKSESQDSSDALRRALAGVRAIDSGFDDEIRRNSDSYYKSECDEWQETLKAGGLK